MASLYESLGSSVDVPLYMLHATKDATAAVVFAWICTESERRGQDGWVATSPALIADALSLDSSHVGQALTYLDWHEYILSQSHASESGGKLDGPINSLIKPRQEKIDELTSDPLAMFTFGLQYHPRLGAVTGSAAGALIMLVAYTERDYNDGEQWFPEPMGGWANNAGLTSEECAVALESLIARGFLESNNKRRARWRIGDAALEEATKESVK